MKKSVILASIRAVCGERPSSDLAEFVESFVGQTSDEFRKQAEILKNEYGIEFGACPVSEIKPVEIKRRDKPHFFVPKSIGRKKKGFGVIKQKKIKKF